MTWPAFVLIKENESLSSWLARLAYSHGQNVEFFKEIWPQWNFKDIDLDNDIEEELASYTTVSLNSIRRNTSYGDDGTNT